MAVPVNVSDCPKISEVTLEESSCLRDEPWSLRPPGKFCIALLRLQKFGVDVFVPGVEAGLHGGDSVWHFGGQIGAFADVVLQVVEVESAIFEAFDQFVVSDSDGAAGDAALI
jgi:hypothetical protein